MIELSLLPLETGRSPFWYECDWLREHPKLFSSVLANAFAFLHFGTIKNASRFLSRTLCSRWHRRLKVRPPWLLKDNLLYKHAHQILHIQLKITGLRFAYASSEFKSVIECYCVDAWTVIIVNTILECWLSLYRVIATKHSYQYDT